MYDLTGKTVVLNAAFRPRADADLLSRAVQNAWETRNMALGQLQADFKVVDEIIALFSRLYPAADMDVLARYGKAQMCERVLCRVYNGTCRWDLTTSVEIPEDKRILIPYDANTIYTCGPRYSEDPMNGLKPEYRASLSAEELQKIVDQQTADDARRLPVETETYFEAIAAAQLAYKAEYKSVTNWPIEQKKEKGEYPTWEAIADAFPVTGEYIRLNLVQA